MATNSTPANRPDAPGDEEPVPGIAHPTVVPTNFDPDDDEA